MAETVDVILRLLQARQFISEAEKSSKAIGGVGTAAEKSGKQSGFSAKSLLKWGGAAGAVYGATKFLKGSIDTTEQLGSATLALNRTTGMSIKTSSEWAATLQSRNIDAKTFQRSMVTLSKQIVTSNTAVAKSSEKTRELRAEYDKVAAAGGKKAPAALKTLTKQIETSVAKGDQAVSMWKQLGVSMEDVRKGNTEAVLMQVSDGLSKIKDPALRAALAQKLFSKGGLALAPMLFKGSKAIKEQLGLTEKYGLALSGKNAKAIKQNIADEREMRLAYMGVQVSLGKALLPVMVQLSQLVLKIVSYLAPFIKRGWLVKGVILAIAAAFVVLKIATLAQAAAQAIFNTTLAASGIGLIILAIAALVLGLILLVKNWDKVKAAWWAVWSILKQGWEWIKQNWPLLLAILTGPIGIAALMIYRNFDKIKAGFFTVLDWVRKNWPLIVGLLTGPMGLAIAEVIHHWSDLKSAIGRAIDWVIGKVRALLDLIKSIPSKIGNVATSIIKKIPGGSTALHVGSSIWNAIPGHQHGGHIPAGMPAIVGERGPELIRLPINSYVTPLAGGALGGGAGGELTIHVPVFLDRRQIAEAVARYTADKAARR